MAFRIATFNVENLMNRFDFSGYRNALNQDRTLSLYEISSEDEYRQLERARTIAHTDDTRQLTALAIAATRADILCLQEVDNIDALRAFEYGYLFKMVGAGYRNKYTTAGNDTRGIDVAVMTRDQTGDGEPIEFVHMTSHAHLTYQDMGLATPELKALGNEPYERIFRRDCLEIDLRVAGRPLTVYAVHLKSMGSPRDGLDGRSATMPIRMAEAKAIRAIIEERFGAGHAADKNWVVCGDFNDYQERIVIGGEAPDFSFTPVSEQTSSLDLLLADGFARNPVSTLDPMERWTLYHTRGPQERHLCQLDYVLLSRALANRNQNARPAIIRNGQPFRTIFPPAQGVDRYPRVGWDRPKASDHCPVAITLSLG